MRRFRWVQLSLTTDLDPLKQYQAGQAIASLRDEGVLIVGSGMSFHNMRGMVIRALARSPMSSMRGSPLPSRRTPPSGAQGWGNGRKRRPPDCAIRRAPKNTCCR